jgi:uncharacterized protein
MHRQIEAVEAGGVADRANVPTLAEAMVAHAALSESMPEMQAIIDKDGAKRLY